MSWVRLSVEAEASRVEPLVDLLERFGAVSVSVTAAGGGPLLAEAAEHAGYWALSRISALLPADAEPDIVIACLRNRAGAGALHSCRMEAVEDRDWTAASRASSPARMFGGRLCVCPGWAQPLPAEHVLHLDPGLAFGTGAHATTAMCLEWLAAQDCADLKVIDYGCGSGILALAAAAFGARCVTAVDLDPQAVAATIANAERNGLNGRIRVQDTAAELPVSDLVMANILLRPLLELAPRFAQLLVPGGRVVLSGILANQAADCLAHYGRWFTMAAPVYRDEWALIRGERAT